MPTRKIRSQDIQNYTTMEIEIQRTVENIGRAMLIINPSIIEKTLKLLIDKHVQRQDFKYFGVHFINRKQLKHPCGV